VKQSEKNWIEKLADWIPGISGYRAREEARETDQRLRSFVSQKLDACRGQLLRSMGELPIDALTKIGQIERRMQRASDEIRLAKHGYSGFFDQLKIRENELGELYQLDLQLMGLLGQVDEALEELPKDLGTSLEKAVDGILAAHKNRNMWFDNPNKN